MLFLSDKTVRNHISSILFKLGVSTRAKAIALANDAGLRPRLADRLPWEEVEWSTLIGAASRGSAS